MIEHGYKKFIITTSQKITREYAVRADSYDEALRIFLDYQSDLIPISETDGDEELLGHDGIVEVI